MGLEPTAKDGARCISEEASMSMESFGPVDKLDRDQLASSHTVVLGRRARRLRPSEASGRAGNLHDRHNGAGEETQAPGGQTIAERASARD